MTQQAVLIAAFSGRALAASARSAGYAPLVVDCFGDDDLAGIAADSMCLPARVLTGFRIRPLLDALRTLSERARTTPIGLVLGSGFECDPRLLGRLASEHRLLGNSPETIARVKDPATFFPALAGLGIAHPETTLTAPKDSDGWLMKRVGGSGGLHIVTCPGSVRPDRCRYFQRKVDGTALSAIAVVGGASHAFAFSRQWTSPLPKRPYRYGGAVGPLTLDPDLEARLIDISLAVVRAFDLIGLMSLDFLVSETGEINLLEVNPRPGATLDVFEDARGTLFEAHLACCTGADPLIPLRTRWQPPQAKAAAFVYADAGAVEIGKIAWPDWAADRPRAGTLIASHQPVATAMAEADTSHAAEALCRRRLGSLQDLIYGTKTGEDLPT